MSLAKLGLIPSGLLDFPGRVAATVFTMGCPLSCPYCHNPGLVRGPFPRDFFSRKHVLSVLEKRRRHLGGVAVTGGEPLMHADLPDLLAEIAAFRLELKLDTSGIFPKALDRALASDSIVHVAMDIKTSFGNYSRVATRISPEKAAQAVATSMDILRTWKDAAPDRRTLEFRTVFSPVANPEDLDRILAILRPNEQWTITPFRAGTCLDPAYNSLPSPHLSQLAHIALQAQAQNIRLTVRA